MKHYTYILECDDKAYIGVRSCQGDPQEDDYWGTSKHLPKDIAEGGSKRILGVHKTREEAVQREIDLHDLFDVGVNPMFYNQAKQTSTGFDRSGTKLSAETRAKLSAAQTGKKFSDEHRAKMSASKMGHEVSAETRAKMSANHADVSGDNNPMYGKPSAMSNPKWQRTCPHCSKTMDKANYTQWHGDNCKQNYK